jgi:hypothetical protein
MGKMNGFLPYATWGEDGKECILEYLSRTDGNIRIGRHVGTVAYIGHYGISVVWR